MHVLQAKEVAGEAAKAEARAAAAALRAVEAGIAIYAERRDYLKLKDIAEASDVAGKVGQVFLDGDGLQVQRGSRNPVATSVALVDFTGRLGMTTAVAQCFCWVLEVF